MVASPRKDSSRGMDSTAGHVSTTALPGLDHLRPHVPQWNTAVRSLAFTAGVLADSLRAPTTLQASSPSSPAHLPPCPPPAVYLTAGQLKTGRLFIVADLRGAYHTLMELLSRHKFDFRTDNLMHLGNLVAPPLPPVLSPSSTFPPPLPTPQTPSSLTAASPFIRSSPFASAAGAAAAAAAGSAPRRCRHSASVLRLIRRHNARGPMGSNECLTLLAEAVTTTATASVTNAAKQHQYEQRSGLLSAGTELDEASSGVLQRSKQQLLQPRRSALSLQLAAAAPRMTSSSTTSVTSPEPAAPTRQRMAGEWRAATGDNSSDLDSDSDSEADSSDSDGEVSGGRGGGDVLGNEGLERHEQAGGITVAGGASAGRSGGRALCCDMEEPARPAKRSAWTGATAATTRARSSATAKTTTSSSASSSWTPQPDGRLSDSELAHLLALPACLIVEEYGIVLKHAGGGDATNSWDAVPNSSGDAGLSRRYHTIFSHLHTRCSSSGGSGSSTARGVAHQQGSAATATGLASSREVVRCAVLPPVSVLSRTSAGWVSKVKIGRGGVAGAPTRTELQIVVVEERLSELDV